MKLVLKKFTCLDATDDPGGDSPYFVVFVGNPKDLEAGPIKLSELDFQIATVWKAVWDDVIDDGDTRAPNMTVKLHDGTPLKVTSNSCVLVALCEQDDNVDITQEERLEILNDLKGSWTAAGGGVATSSGPSIATTIRHKFAHIVDDALSNDDLLGVAKIKPTYGEHTVHYQSNEDGYHYKVIFAIE